MKNSFFREALKFSEVVPTKLRAIVDNSRLSNGDPKDLFMITSYFMKEEYITEELLQMIYFAWLSANGLLREPLYKEMKENWSIIYRLIVE